MSESKDTKQMLQEAKLNQAAQDLLAQLPDHAGQLVHSLSKQFQIPLWQYLSGILLAVHLEGRLSEFRLDPAWKDGLRTKELICKQCKKSFTPRHIAQPYCCNECGLIAAGVLPQPSPKQESINVNTSPKSKSSADSPTFPNPVGWTEALEAA